MRHLYHQSRAAEVATAGWPAAVAAAFLDDQLRLQTAHFATNHVDAERSVITALEQGRRVPIGRRYVDGVGAEWRLLEIGLLDEWQGRGIGAALIVQLQQELVEARGESLVLNVLRSNVRAATLYARLGFTESASLVVTHRTMIWRPS